MKYFVLFNFLVSSVFGFANTATPDTAINICDRGVVGDKIAEAVGAQSCKSVSLQKMQSLKDLYLNKIKVKTLKPPMFDGLIALEALALNDCGIEAIADDTFKDLSALMMLGLQDNRLTSINARTFAGLTNMVSAIDLSRLPDQKGKTIKINSIEAQAFSFSKTAPSFMLSLEGHDLNEISRKFTGLNKQAVVFGPKVVD